MANPGHVPGGDLKGVMNDSNVSDDAEERAEHRLDTAFKSQQPSHTKAPENVTRGSKASLHSPNVSEDKKHDLLHKLDDPF